MVIKWVASVTCFHTQVRADQEMLYLHKKYQQHGVVVTEYAVQLLSLVQNQI